MSELIPLLDRVAALCELASEVTEESFRLNVTGAALTPAVASELLAIRAIVTGFGLEAPAVLADGQNIDDGELVDLSISGGEPWRLILAKAGLAARVAARADEVTVLFFTVEGMLAWTKSRDPFIAVTAYEPDFSKPVTLRVNGLVSAFGGPELWVLPIDAEAPSMVGGSKLPTTSAVNDIIHLNVDKLIKVAPRGWALTWGDLESSISEPWRRLSGMVLAACLVQELRRSDGVTQVTIRGTKRLSVPLVAEDDVCDSAHIARLVNAVQWVYAERAETRLKLVMDRLSIDIDGDQSFLKGLSLYLAAAVQQAQDSYAFVILERKEAYFKEMRELMKDMKSQADLYAAKVRDLVASVTRDVLGVLVLIGFSFLGKFDATNLRGLLASPELGLLLKFLACYLVFSYLLQLATHWRDAQLGFDESKKWIGVLQNYTSTADKKEQFLDPIEIRRRTLWIALAFSALIYVGLAVAVWKLPAIVSYLLT